MRHEQLQDELFSQIAGVFTAEEIFDCLPDVVYFVKNRRGEYVVVNQTLVERCGCRHKRELLGRRPDELFPAPLGQYYRAQDESVLRHGKSVLKQMELHFYASRGRGWCLTDKLPLFDSHRQVIGLVGISKDLHPGIRAGDDYPRIAKAVEHIQKNFGEPLRISQLAKEAGLSSYQFKQRIWKTFQVTVGQLIQKTRIEAALRQLRETADPIASVALDCGYSDQSAFTRRFRQTVGLSPSEYRASSA